MVSSQEKSKTIQLAVVRYVYLISGFLLVAIGIIGIFLPLLPTTIFLILASACFVKSSPKTNEWLRNNKYLGQYIKNYQEGTGLTIKSKIFTIAFLWASIIFSAFFFTEVFYIRMILFAIAVGVSIHLITVKTKRA